MRIILTGATGLIGGYLLQRINQLQEKPLIKCVVRPTTNTQKIKQINPNINYFVGDTSSTETWDLILKQENPEVIIHIVSILHIEAILKSLKKAQQTPRLIIIGTTGVYSKYRESADNYKQMQKLLTEYTGSYCLLRPTMIYGSHQDKNLHKLIRFCDRYGFFPVFGSGKNLVQPVHADDLAQAILTALQRPNIEDTYDLSGDSIVTFQELLSLTEKLLDKPVRQISLPINFGIFSATILEKILKKRSPVRREQILRLQEDKAYPHDAAKRDLEFSPRSLEVGLKEEVELMRSQGIIST